MSNDAWPTDERPRERLVDKGPGALADAELLALVLGCGSPHGSALEVARRVVAVAGGLRPLASHGVARRHGGMPGRPCPAKRRLSV